MSNQTMTLEQELRQAIKLCELQARLLKKRDRLFPESKPPERLIRLPELLSRCGVSKRSVYRLEAEGRFPARRQIGPRAVGWLASEIEAWIKSR